MVLNGAFSRAVRWRWIGTNLVKQAQAPAASNPEPQPPSPAQAAATAAEAWADPDWGMLVWLAMTTGARRGELCALRWDRIDFSTGVVDIRASIGHIKTRVWEKDTKTHQRRRIVPDAQTLALLRAYLRHVAGRAAALDVELRTDAFVFSRSPDCLTPLKPGSVTQRYTRMCTRLGWDLHLHQLRHYCHRAHLRRCRSPHRGGSARPCRGRHDHAAGLQRVGCRSRPASGVVARGPDARAAEGRSRRRGARPSGTRRKPASAPSSSRGTRRTGSSAVSVAFGAFGQPRTWLTRNAAMKPAQVINPTEFPAFW